MEAGNEFADTLVADFLSKALVVENSSKLILLPVLEFNSKQKSTIHLNVFFLVSVVG